MANIYVRSTDGSNSDDGSTWALAKADLTGAAAIDSAGDTIYISDAHAESTASALTFALAGTLASPTKIICGDDAAEPPTTISSAGSITTTGANNITFSGVAYSVYGLTFNIGSGAVNASLILTNTTAAYAVFDDCDFYCVATGSGGQLQLSGAFSCAHLKNCGISFAGTGQTFSNAITNGSRIVMEGGGLISGTSTPSTAFIEINNGEAFLTGVDLSAAANTLNIFNQSATGPAKGVIRNSKLPSTWAGSLVTGTLPLNCRYELRNCSASDTNYALWVEDYAGSIKHETTLVKTGGASDGTTPISWKMVTSANAEYPQIVLRSPEIAKWNETTGSAITVTVDFLHDSATNLQDDEIWLEVEYLGTSGFPLSVFTDDAAADVLTTPADQTTSAATWTTTGMTNPNEQKLSVTFTPQEKGLIIAKVCMANASYTAYIDPELQVS